MKREPTDGNSSCFELENLTPNAADETPRSAPAKRQRKGYRPMPRDFIERWPEVGWTAAEPEWRAHARTIARWVDEAGRKRMVARRKAYLADRRAKRARELPKTYRLTPASGPPDDESGGGGRDMEPETVSHAHRLPCVTGLPGKRCCWR